MEVYILIVERQGIRDFSGIAFTLEEANKQKNDIGRAYILTEKIDENKLVNNQFFLGSRYNQSHDLHDYVGVFYSFDVAKKWCGERSQVLGYTLKNTLIAGV